MFLFSAHAHSRKDRERRPQVVRRSAPDSGVLIRLKAQMAEVRSKLTDTNGPVLEARRAGEPRPGPSGGCSGEEVPPHHGDSELSSCREPGELDLLMGAAAARPRPGRPGEDSYDDVTALKMQGQERCSLTSRGMWIEGQRVL